MDYETAIKARVTTEEAFRECKAHGQMCDDDGREFFDCVTGEVIARIGKDGMLPGAKILAWLGY